MLYTLMIILSQNIINVHKVAGNCLCLCHANQMIRWYKGICKRRQYRMMRMINALLGMNKFGGC